MGTLFWIFSHISGYFAVLVLAASISSGLYMMSVLAEEFPTTMGKALKYFLAAMSLIQFALWLDGLPSYQCAVEACALVAYGGVLVNFPFIDLLSFAVIAAVIGFVATNVVWLQYFLKSGNDPLSVLGFFVMVVWALPCGLVASLTINDYDLPTTTPEKRKSSFRVAYDFLLERLDALTAGFGGLLHALKLVKDKRAT